MTVGFLPFSTVGYNISKTHDFEDVDNNGKWAESYNGDGGFHQVFVGLGYKVFNNLSVGANFSYLLWRHYPSIHDSYWSDRYT